MSLATVTGERPVMISGIYARQYTVRNAGTVEVYLGTDSAVNQFARSLTLTRGASMQWDGSSELWAVTAEGTSTVLEWLYEAVVIGGGDINVSNSVRTASIPKLLATYDYTLNASTTDNSLVYEPIDVSDYASVIFNITFVTPSVDLAGAIRVTDWFTVYTRQTSYKPPFEMSGYTNEAQFLIDSQAIATGSSNSYQIPVASNMLKGSFRLRKLRTNYALRIVVEIFGSGERIDKPRYRNTIGLEDLSVGGMARIVNLPTDATAEYALCNLNTRLYVSYTIEMSASSSVAVQVLVARNGSVSQLRRVDAAAAASPAVASGDLEIPLVNLPLYVRVYRGTGLATTTLAFTH